MCVCVCECKTQRSLPPLSLTEISVSLTHTHTHTNTQTNTQTNTSSLSYLYPMFGSGPTPSDEGVCPGFIQSLWRRQVILEEKWNMADTPGTQQTRPNLARFLHSLPIFCLTSVCVCVCYSKRQGMERGTGISIQSRAEDTVCLGRTQDGRRGEIA